MNTSLWIVQIASALLYIASGIMKVFMFEKASEGVQSFNALPRKAWTAFGIVELICALGLVIPSAFHWHPIVTAIAAIILALESLVFVWVHAKYHETTPIILSLTLFLIMVFIAGSKFFGLHT